MKDKDGKPPGKKREKNDKKRKPNDEKQQLIKSTNTDEEKFVIKKEDEKQYLFIDFSRGDSLRSPSRQPSSALLPHLAEREQEFIELFAKGSLRDVKTFMAANPGINVNCQSYDGSTPLREAIENDSLALVELLLKHRNLLITDEVLFAIREGNVEIITKLLDKIAETRSEFLPPDSSSEFAEEITPLMLAAHCNNFQVVQLLIKRGHRIEKPHRPKCFCKEKCQKKILGECLNEPKERISIFKALVKPAYIFNTSSDPILTCFELSQELEEYAYIEKEFKEDYLTLAEECKVLPVDLVDECKASEEAETLLLAREGCDRPEEKMIRYPRLGLAIDCGHRRFVAHSNVQHILRTAWLDDWGDWKKLSNVSKMLRVVPRIVFLPLIALAYIICPNLNYVRSFRTPINKFLISSASYIIFLTFLLSFHIQQRGVYRLGAPETGLKWVIMVYVLGLLFLEIKQWHFLGTKRHFSQWWNLYDVAMLTSFLSTFVMWYWAERNAITFGHPTLERGDWDNYEPTLIAEGFLAFASVLAFCRLLFILQVSQDLGPLQVSFSRMFGDIAVFLSLFTIILASFTLGMGNLYEYYNGAMRVDPNGRKFYQAGSFVGYQASLKTFFWSIFGMSPFESADVIIDNDFGNDEINKHLFTEGVGYILFGTYHVVVVIVLLNLLIAMMSNSYQHIQDNQDVEWKVARTKVWLSFFEEGSTLPPPFNMIPTPKTLVRCCTLFRTCCKRTKQVKPLPDTFAYDTVMRKLIQRYLNTREREMRQSAANQDSLDDVMKQLNELKIQLEEFESREIEREIRAREIESERQLQEEAENKKKREASKDVKVIQVAEMPQKKPSSNMIVVDFNNSRH